MRAAENDARPASASREVEVKLVTRVVPGEATDERDVQLFAPEGSPGGCASGECLPPPPLQLEEQAPEPDAEHEAAAPTSRVADAELWRRAVEHLRNTSPRHGKSLSYARFLGFVPEGVKLAFPADAAFHRAQIVGMSRAMVEAELGKSLRRPIKLLEDTNAAALEAAPKSIAEVEQSERSTRERGIDDKVRAHPALRAIARHLGGTLEHVSYLEPVAKAPRAADDSDAAPPVD